MTLPRMMKIVQADSAGTADALQFRDCPVPHPGAGQVLIKVESASVNFSDVKRRRGDAYPFRSTFPFVPGGEVAGTVVALGPGVEAPAVGTPVFALVGGDGHGGYAQFALAFAPQVTPMMPGIDFDHASGIIVAGATAALLVRQAARMQAGESVLVPAASGAVGNFLVQFARHVGARLVIAASSGGAPRAQPALELGAHAAVDYTRRGWVEEVKRLTGGRGVDVLFEATGGGMLEEGLQALAPFGRAVVYGAASGVDATLGATALRSVFYDPAPNQSLVAFNVGSWFMQRPDTAGAAIGELMGLVASGAIRMPAIQTLPLSGAAEAHRLLESRQASGKLVLKPWA